MNFYIGDRKPVSRLAYTATDNNHSLREVSKANLRRLRRTVKRQSLSDCLDLIEALSGYQSPEIQLFLLADYQLSGGAA